MKNGVKVQELMKEGYDDEDDGSDKINVEG